MISSLDLARLCAVSQGTVDRALHDRPGIGKVTKEKVLSAARKYGYLPHPAARELLTGERRQVGAIIPSANSVFFMDLINAVREELSSAGYRFFLSPVKDKSEFIDAVADFSARRARAILVIPPEDDVLIPDELVSDDTILTALVNPCRGHNVHFIGPDEEQTGEEGVRFLFEQGHTRIAHLTYPRSSYAVNGRARGYNRAMQKEGLPASIVVPVDAQSLMHTVRTYRPTALFCHNDWLALSAMRILQSNGIRTPEDISILGVDNSPTFTAICPGITSMSYPYKEIAQQIGLLVSGGKDTADIAPCKITMGETVAAPGLNR